MTTVEIFHRLGRMTRSGDFTKLSMTEQGDVLQSANAAMQEVYGMLPTVYKELTEGFLLPAPATVTLAVTQNSNVLSSDVFDVSQIGRSVVLDGDANWNQVIAPNRLMNPYLGSSGTVNGMVYGDAVYSTRYPFERIIGNPRFPNQGSTLTMNPNLRATNDGAGWWIFQQSIGVPLYWWTQALGNSQGNNPMLVLRFSPAPSKAYTVNVRMSYWPKRLVRSDYENATDLPAPDQFLDGALIPIALQAMTMTPIWNEKLDVNRFNEGAERARKFLRERPAQLGGTNNRVYTPIGF